MAGIVALAYGVVCYFIFFGSFLYAIGFVGNIAVPKVIDSGTEGPLAVALGVNLALLGAFAIQHSVMARPAFKKWWTRFVPVSVERSTYVLLSSLLLLLLFWQWRPLPAAVWDVTGTLAGRVLTAAFWAGWLLVLVSTFLVNHFDLFGLRQVWLRFRDQPYTHVGFRRAAFYRYVRHPIMLGFIIAFWSAARMTQGHLLFALATTGYIFIGIFLEERDLKAVLPEYQEYSREVSMIVPLPGKK